MKGAATATAHANIALIKYWGKADDRLHLPRTSSLSVTLDGLETTTTVVFGGSPQDELVLDGVPRSGEQLRRVSVFLDLIRSRSDESRPARVVSQNRVSTAAGLASSASGFAALAAAGARAAGLDLDDRALSRLARRGSGSASRSIFGGLVVWHAGSDDATSFAEPVPCGTDLSVLVITLSGAPKAISSREAMRRTVRTSPLYEAWATRSTEDLREVSAALERGDLESAGPVIEANALGMHATMLAARPAILYWMPETLGALAAVREARAAGFPAWATIDAGPNVKVVTDAAYSADLLGWMRRRLPEATVTANGMGPGVRVREGAEL